LQTLQWTIETVFRILCHCNYFVIVAMRMCDLDTVGSSHITRNAAQTA